jgi:predicted pyridoxine 5'-phosphate oxidase superfamily flavin-nucleotide-binding protein
MQHPVVVTIFQSLKRIDTELDERKTPPDVLRLAVEEISFQWHAMIAQNSKLWK